MTAVFAKGNDGRLRFKLLSEEFKFNDTVKLSCIEL